MTETSIKKTLYISATPPATKNLAGYQALTWIKVTGVVTIGQIGFSHATIEAPDLESGITQTLKGARSGTAGQVAYRRIASDAGQAAVAAANETESEVAIQIVDPDGATSDYWTGIVHSHMDNEASVTSYEGSTFTFVPNYAKVRGASEIS
ncbi:hypothetical protein [Paracoccus kondratievae]|uniref:Uncharacterized protein n=1 Tax=Paracoccus kondratievae TaxID=135740 RepID=A0AAD3NX21_9RHOB|nr:hypothetical protein [Paracoccus kondratievae]AZV00276.1 hypothetical protein pkon1_p47 [Paracoccus phage vB_PkoS_Pkon1]GLK63472.1 hypothetical protein GCM10017635_09420 [Paracoccus kondratievae]